METVTVSPKFQVVIPKEIRESLNLLPGQKIQALLYENRIELIPVRPIKKMRGFLKGIDTTIDRKTDRAVNVVDSSGWLEYFADGPNADFFANSVLATGDLLVPTLSLYEVFKRVLQQRGEDDALQAVALMQQGSIVELTGSLALSAARISLNDKIPMADSIMLATARAYGATLWSQDSDFEHIAGVKYIAKK